MTIAPAVRHAPTAREQSFLDTVENPRYERSILNGLDVFFEGRAPVEMQGLYTPEELEVLRALRGTERDVETRMPVKITRHYFELARHSPNLQRLSRRAPTRPSTSPGPRIRDSRWTTARSRA
jgi:lysine 2,3-aminomutase